MMEKKVLSEKNLDAIIQMLGKIAALDFSTKLKLDDADEQLAAVALGLNWLAEELEANVVEKSKLEEINRFAITAAHDMKSPLNSSKILIELIEAEQGNSPKDIGQYLNALKEINDRAVQLIDGILKYSMQGSKEIDMHAVDFDQLCRKSISSYNVIEKIDITINDKLPVVIHNETMLSQIVDNLLSNAVKYNDKEICTVLIACDEKSDHYEIGISDNGPGIHPNAHDKIFDLFENLRAKAENSSGIGLATVKKILSQTNGRIWVESNQEVGAKFVFTIQKNEPTFQT